MYKSKFGLSVTYLKSMVTDNPKTQKRIMGKNNSEVSLSDVDYDQIILSRLEDQKYEICCKEEGSRFGHFGGFVLNIAMFIY